ncbi:MAG: LiaF transmembrane domain-containing protein, partial [Mucilaginibacter sp.]
MRNDKLIPGLILVMIGAIFLLNNFDVIDFHWSNLFHLWPIFLVIGGVNLVFAHNRSPWATILKISVVVAGFALLLFGNHSTRYRWWPHYTYNNNDNSSNDDGD